MQATNEQVVVHHGGSLTQGEGLQTVHRIHVDANGVEYICLNKVFTPITQVAAIVSRDTIPSS